MLDQETSKHAVMIRERDTELREQTVKFFEERKLFHETEWKLQAMERELESKVGMQRIAELRLDMLRTDFKAYRDNGVRAHWNDDRPAVIDFIVQTDLQARTEILHRLLARAVAEGHLPTVARTLAQAPGGPGLLAALSDNFRAAAAAAATVAGADAGIDNLGVAEAGRGGVEPLPSGAGAQGDGGAHAAAGPDPGGAPTQRADAQTQTAPAAGSGAVDDIGGILDGGPGRRSPTSGLLGRRNSLAAVVVRVRTAPDFRRRLSSVSGQGEAPAGLQLVWRGSYYYTPSKAAVRAPIGTPSPKQQPAAVAAAAAAASSSEDDEGAQGDSAPASAGAAGAARPRRGRAAREAAAFDHAAETDGAGGGVEREVRFREADDPAARAASVRMLGKLIAHVYEEKALADDVSAREGRPAEDARAFLKHFFFRRCRARPACVWVSVHV